MGIKTLTKTESNPYGVAEAKLGTMYDLLEAVASITADISSLASNYEDVQIVAQDIGSVTTVANVSTDVTTVAGSISDVTAVAADIASVNTIADNIDNLVSWMDAENLEKTVNLLDLATLSADTAITYGTGSPLYVQAGDAINTSVEDYVYLVAASTATDHDAVTAGGVKLYVLPKNGGVWDAQFFTHSNDADRVQAAIDWVINKTKTSTEAYKVFVVGTYTMDHPIGIFDFDGSNFNYCTVEIEAPSGGYVSNKRTSFTFTNPLWPGIVIEKARNVIIKNVSILGAANSRALPTYDEMLERDTPAIPWWRKAQNGTDTGAADIGVGGRIHGLHSGIVWDIFNSGQPAADKFSYYDGTTAGVPNHYTGGGGTTSTELINCEVQGWIVGAQTAGSSTQLGDSFTFKSCNFSYNRIHYMIGESQNRGIVAVDCHGKGCDVILAGGSGYGTGTGSGNYVRGGVYVFNYALVDISSDRGNGAFTDVYAESTWTVGHVTGSFGFTFKDCNIKIVDGVQNNSKQPDGHLTGNGAVRFVGGYVGTYANDSRRLNMAQATAYSFQNVTFQDVPFVYNDDLPMFENCKCRGVNTKKFGGTHMGNLVNYLARSTYAVGDTFIDANGDVFKATSRSSGQSLGSIAITDNNDGTATFSVSALNANNLIVGDYIAALNFQGMQNNRTKTVANLHITGIGRISDISGTTITIKGVSKSLTSATYNLYTHRLPKVLRPTAGDITNGSATVTNVSNPNDWSVGDFIRTPANNGWVAPGTRIVAKDNTLKTLTLSNPATATRTAEWLTDGELTLIQASGGGAPASGHYHRGAYMKNNYPLSVDANNMVLDGWICVTGGSPGTWEPVYLSTVSPAT